MNAVLQLCEASLRESQRNLVSPYDLIHPYQTHHMSYFTLLSVPLTAKYPYITHNQFLLGKINNEPIK